MSGMRYIEVPKPETLLLQKQDQATGELKVAGVKPYTYFDMLEEFVWRRDDWRKNQDYYSAWERLCESHEEAQRLGSKFIAMTEEDYTKFEPMAILKGIDLNPVNAKAITRLTRGVIFAASKKPAELEQQTNGETKEQPAQAAPP